MRMRMSMSVSLLFISYRLRPESRAAIRKPNDESELDGWTTEADAERSKRDRFVPSVQVLAWAGGEDTFWLDSSDEQRGRFAFLGGPGGELWRRVEYHVRQPPAPATLSDSGAALASEHSGADSTYSHSTEDASGVVSTTFADGREVREAGPLRRWVAAFLAAHALPRSAQRSSWC